MLGSVFVLRLALQVRLNKEKVIEAGHLSPTGVLTFQNLKAMRSYLGGGASSWEWQRRRGLV